MHGAVISLAKTFAIVVAKSARNPGMAVLIAIIHVRTAVIVEVLAGAFDAVVKPLTLDLAKLSRRRIPSAAVLAIT
jgi:chemotaxis protein histidine kinase CheA